MTADAGRDHFAASGGFALLHRYWAPSPGPRRRLAIVHGLAEHSERYDHVASWFAVRGYSVHAFDQRGHGRSEGPRAHAPSFEALLDDLEHFLRHLERADSEGPLVVLGHSMGGLEVASWLVRRRPAIAAAVLSAPALEVPTLGGVRRLLLRLLSRIAPRVRVPGGIDLDGLSRDPEVIAAYAADPLVDKRYSARLLTEIAAAVRWIEGRGAEVAVPLLIVHGEADPICPVAGSRRFSAVVRSPGSELRAYPELRHEVLNEPEREQVLSDIARWIEKQVPGS